MEMETGAGACGEVGRQGPGGPRTIWTAFAGAAPPEQLTRAQPFLRKYGRVGQAIENRIRGMLR